MSVAIVDDHGYRYDPDPTFDEDAALAAALQVQLSEQVEAEERVRRAELLQQKTYSGAQMGISGKVTPKFIYTMMIICLIFFGIELLVNNNKEGEYFEDFQNNPLIGPSEDTLIFMGAKRTDLIVDEKDFWRVFMPIFLHAGVIHLVFNMVFLYSFGTSLEREFGHLRIAYIFFISGVVGILTSAIFNPTEASVGASGACYGLIGASWSEFFLNFSFYKKTNWQGWLCQLAFGTIINLCLGLIPTLDNFAHIGGFLSGIFAGLQVLTLPRYDYFLQEKPERWTQVLLKACGFFITPVSLIICIIVLYVGVDVNRYCPWCRYMNCVPTPYWFCDVDCRTEEFSIIPQADGSIEIVCPRDIGTVLISEPDPNLLSQLEGNRDAQVELCDTQCVQIL